MGFYLEDSLDALSILNELRISAVNYDDDIETRRIPLQALIHARSKLFHAANHIAKDIDRCFLVWGLVGRYVKGYERKGSKS